MVEVQSTDLSLFFKKGSAKLVMLEAQLHLSECKARVGQPQTPPEHTLQGTTSLVPGPVLSRKTIGTEEGFVGATGVTIKGYAPR